MNRQNWAIVGSGPSGLGLGKDELAGVIVIAVDSAASHIPYDLIDYHLTRHHPCYSNYEGYPESLPARVRLIGFPIGRCRPFWHKKGLGGCAGPGVECMDSEIPIKGHPLTWERGRYTPEREPIGPHGLQYALNNGADHLSVWGMEANFEGHATLDDSQEYQGRIMQIIVDACPDVTFKMHGQLTYPLTGPNVHG